MHAIVQRRKNPSFAHDGYLYRFDRQSFDSGKFWRCQWNKCHGRIKTDENDVFVEFRNMKHKHGRDPDAINRQGIVETADREPETISFHEADDGEFQMSSLHSSSSAVPLFNTVNMYASVVYLFLWNSVSTLSPIMSKCSQDVPKKTLGARALYFVF